MFTIENKPLDIKDQKLYGRLLQAKEFETGGSQKFESSPNSISIDPLGDILPNSGVTAGTYGSATESTIVTVSDKGIITSISQIDIENNVLLKTVTITSVQILALNTTPIELIQAQGVDTYIIVDSVVARNNFNTIAYVGFGDISIRYTNGSGSSVVEPLSETLFLESVASTVNKKIAVSAVPVSNSSIVISADTANPTTGNGTFSINILYRVVTF